MTQKIVSKFLRVAALLIISLMVAPGLANAKLGGVSKHGAQPRPVDSSIMATYGDSMPLLSAYGDPVTGNAWCYPTDNQCLQHPWMHHMRTTGTSAKSDK